MDCQVAAAIAAAQRQTVVSEPSPVFVLTAENIVSYRRRIEANSEDVANRPGSSQERNDYVVPVPEQSTSQSTNDAETTAFLEPEQDDFGTTVEGCWQIFRNKFIEYYKEAWTIINNDYAIPVWLLLLSVPVSAGIMSSLYMYSCPAAPNMAEAMFTVGISLMAIISFRICLILRQVTIIPNDECHKMLQSLILLSTSVTVLFFVAEASSYWKMTPSPYRYLSNFCHPKFQTFSFWWNCVMSVLIVPIILFPV